MSKAFLRDYLKGWIDLQTGQGIGLLKQGYAYRSVEDLLLQHGREWQPAADQDSGIPDMETFPKHCFDNAFKMAVFSGGKLAYVEGYALDIIPTEHAWCVNSDGLVIDPTWHRHANGIGKEYYGIEIPLSKVIEIREMGNVATALFAWEHKFPLLREQWKNGGNENGSMQDMRRGIAGADGAGA